jgi:hypothetical protein
LDFVQYESISFSIRVETFPRKEYRSTGFSSRVRDSTRKGLPSSYGELSSEGNFLYQGQSERLALLGSGLPFLLLLLRKEVGTMRDLSLLSEDDLFWDPDRVRLLPNSDLARKMGQTYLSRLPYHRTKGGSVSEKLKLSQQIGILIWLNRVDLLSHRGEERLLFLQAKAPWGALDAGMKFALLLNGDFKLQLDFYHWMVILNCFPVTKRLRLWRVNRIGVGYRDKGTLPSPSAGGVRNANESAWVRKDLLQEKIQSFIGPSSDLVEGEWVDLPGLVELLQSGLALEDLHSLLDP